MVKKMLWLGMVMVLGLSCKTYETHLDAGKYFQQTPIKTASYQVRHQGVIVGYVHKYEWETTRGEQLHRYVVYDRKDNLIGQICKDGSTMRYTPEGRVEELGNFELERGLERIYQTPSSIKLVIANEDEEFVALAQASKEPRKEENSLASGARTAPARISRPSPMVASRKEYDDLAAEDDDSGGDDSAAGDDSEAEEAEESEEAEELETWPDENEPWPKVK